MNVLDQLGMSLHARTNFIKYVPFAALPQSPTSLFSRQQQYARLFRTQKHRLPISFPE